MGYFAIARVKDEMTDLEKAKECLEAAQANIKLILEQIGHGHLNYHYLLDFAEGQLRDARKYYGEKKT